MALSNLSVGQILALCFLSLIVYAASNVFYNLFLHPLRRFPGPLLMRATRLSHGIRNIRGTLPFDVLELHKRYGPVVRVAPDELAFSDPRAWRDIFAYRNSSVNKSSNGEGGRNPTAVVEGEEEMTKYDPFYAPLKRVTTDIFTAGREEHALLRRSLAHGFSDRGVREQQPIIQGYIDLLIRRLREKGEDGAKPLDMAAWYNFTTFDIIGDLAFGEGFGCLVSSRYHPWVRSIFEFLRAGTVLQLLAHYPVISKIVTAVLSTRLTKEREKLEQMTKDKLERRMQAGNERWDLIEGLIRKVDEWGVTMDRIQANSSFLVIAGSETTATLLSGVTYLLLTNPRVMEKLVAEIRGAFKSEDEINFTSVSNLPYLLACLDEAMRIYPPGAVAFPRVVPEGGANIAGNYIPEKTAVGVYHWAMYHNDANFKDPFVFHPERWLGDPAFADDRKDAFQPFHLGPRNCLGRNLAYIEMRLILSRILWNFDLRIDEDSLDWMSTQRVYTAWDRGKLNVYLTPVAR